MFDQCLFMRPCHNGATCETVTDGFNVKCTCAEGYKGKMVKMGGICG